MSLILPTATRFYKLCAFLGTIIIIADLALSWVRIDAFEHSVSEVFESMVRTQMEIDGLEQEFGHVEKVLQQSEDATKDSVTVDDIEYTPYEIERLKNEYNSIQLYIQEKQLDLVSLQSQKKFVQQAMPQYLSQDRD